MGWGLKSESEMYMFEARSIMANILVIGAVLVKVATMKSSRSPIIIKVMLWLFVVVFTQMVIFYIVKEPHTVKGPHTDKMC